MSNIVIPKSGPNVMHFMVHGDRVVMVHNGKVITDMPWQSAYEFAKQLQKAGGKAEEFAKREQIIDDQALLIRTNAPIGLSADPHIQKEAFKKAETDRGLRKAIPSVKDGLTIRSAEEFYPPTVKVHSPKKKNGEEKCGKLSRWYSRLLS